MSKSHPFFSAHIVCRINKKRARASHMIYFLSHFLRHISCTHHIVSSIGVNAIAISREYQKLIHSTETARDILTGGVHKDDNASRLVYTRLANDIEQASRNVKIWQRSIQESVSRTHRDQVYVTPSSVLNKVARKGYIDMWKNSMGISEGRALDFTDTRYTHNTGSVEMALDAMETLHTQELSSTSLIYMLTVSPHPHMSHAKLQEKLSDFTKDLRTSQTSFTDLNEKCNSIIMWFHKQ